MNQINFIPATFLAQQERGRRIYRQLAIVAMAAVVLGLWTVGQHRTYAMRKAFAGELQLEVQAVRRSVSEVGKLQAQRAALMQKVHIQRELAQPIPHTNVIATLGRLLPESLVITNLEMKTIRPAPSTTPLDAPPAGQSVKAEPMPRPRSDEPDIIRIEISGLAPGDVEVADFVGRLDEHPLFNNVKMHSSKTTVVKDFVARQFHMEMEVRLDCDYEPAVARQTAAAQEVRHGH